MALQLTTDATAAKSDVFTRLKSAVVRLGPKDRFCILLFDESPVEPKNLPKNEGVNEETYPTHVINFMLRAIYGSWKLPISNIFWKRQGADSGAILGEAIKDMINNISETGLTVIATVSDVSKINVKAINYLMGKPDDINYAVGFNKVFHVFDPCDLLKSLRNNLLKNDLIFDLNGVKKIASWKHIIEIYEIDQKRHKKKRLTKIVPFHVHAKYIDKSNTSFCTQVFSQTFSKEIRNAVEENLMDKSALDTADLLLFFDQLFDSCNGVFQVADPRKKYRCAISCDSPHFEFWVKAETILDSMRFTLPDGKVYRPECLDKWVCSLHGMKNIAKVLKKNKIKYLQTRHFNLDALINMMQILRAYNNNSSRICTEETEGEILDENILRLVLEHSAGYFEIV